MTIIKPKEMSKLLGVTVRTLQAWDRKKILIAHRTLTNKRYYTEDDYSNYINKACNDGTYSIKNTPHSIQETNSKKKNLSSDEIVKSTLLSVLDTFSEQLTGLQKYRDAIANDPTIKCKKGNAET